MSDTGTFGFMRLYRKIQDVVLTAGTAIAGKIYLTNGTYDAEVDSAGNVQTDVNNVTPGTTATDLGKAEDAVHTSGDVGVMTLAVRQDTLSALAADGDYIPLKVDANGRLWVQSILSANDGVDIGDVDLASPLDDATGNVRIIENEHREIHENAHYFVENHTTLNSAATLDFCLETYSTTPWMHLTFNWTATGLMTLVVYEGVDFDADGTLVVQRGSHRAKCFIGTHTGGNNEATVMTDSGASFTVDALIGWKIYNVTDGSYGIITDNDATTVTVSALTGGTDNDWDTNDTYEINQSLAILTTGATVNSTGQQIAAASGGDATNPVQGVPGGQTRGHEWVLRANIQYLFRFTSGKDSNILSYSINWYEHTDVA